MKYTVLNFTGIALFTIIALPLFAIEMYDPEMRLAKLYDEKAVVAKVSGELTFGSLTPFDSAQARIGYASMYADLSLWPDEYNTIFIEFAGEGTFDTTTSFTIPQFNITTDLGTYFRLPFGLRSVVGLTNLYTHRYEVSGHAYEREGVRSKIDPVPYKVLVDAKVMQLNFGIGFGETDPAGDGSFNDIGIHAVIPEAGPAEVELWYLSQNSADFRGNVGVSVRAADLFGELFGVAGGFMYDTRADASPRYAYGIGARVSFFTATLGVSMNGTDEAALNKLGVDADISPGDCGLLTTFAIFNDAAGDELGFYGAEVSVYVKIRNATLKSGYTITEHGYYYTPAVEGNRGGLFIVADVEW